MMRLKHLPNVLIASASQNYICSDQVTSKLERSLFRALRLFLLSRIIDFRPSKAALLKFSLELWKLHTRHDLLTHLEEVLGKLRPFDEASSPSRGNRVSKNLETSSGFSEESIIIAAFSPVSRLESEREGKQLEFKLANITRLLETWKQYMVKPMPIMRHRAVQTALEFSSDSLEGRQEYLKTDTLILQETEGKLEDRKLESLLSIEESYEVEQTLGAKFATLPEVNESEFLKHLPQEDSETLVLRLKSLEKQLIDREHRLIQLTKTTHQELQLLLKEREEINLERLQYAHLQQLRIELDLEAKRLEARSKQLDEVAAELDKESAALRGSTPSIQSQMEEPDPSENLRLKVAGTKAIIQWTKFALVYKSHNQRCGKALSFNAWKLPEKGTIDLTSEKPSTKVVQHKKKDPEVDPTNDMRKRGIILVKTVQRQITSVLRTHLNHFRSKLHIGHSTDSVLRKAKGLFGLCAGRLHKLELSASFTRWKNFSFHYENQLLRTQLSLFDVTLQSVQLQEKKSKTELTVAYHRLESKLLQVLTLCELFLP